MKKRETISLIGSAIIFIFLPDVLSRVETVLTIGYFAAVIWLIYGWVEGQVIRIRTQRERLKVRKTKRKDGIVDVRLKSKAKIIPAYRVEEKLRMP